MTVLYQISDQEADVNEFREKALKITTYSRILQPDKSVWGESEKAVVGIGDIFRPSYSFNNSTFDTNELNNRSFYGYTPEFIVYNRMLTPIERRKAETYLAVKYGLALESSYISSKGTLIWDIVENEGFNNRITGYGRDDASGLYQRAATTSYEEIPYFSDENSYDSFDQNNPYNLPSRYRLLVMGNQPAGSVQDDGFILFGDNDETITTNEIEGVNGIKLMSRRWLVNTNISPATEQEKYFEWDVRDLDTYTEGFKTRAGTTEAPVGSMATKTPLLGQDGYLSWIITSSHRGPLTVKFGTNDPQIAGGKNDYGYYVSNAGQLYKIIKGVRQSSAIETVPTNKKIEVGKEGNIVYIRIGGERKYNNQINIDETDAEKSYYGSIRIEKYNDENVTLSDIRQGGFSDTGNNMELSYVAQRASEFSDYRTAGRSYLVIDRTGKGDFSSEDVEFIPADELDESRSKIIFNNIFWDTDGNGKDPYVMVSDGGIYNLTWGGMPDMASWITTDNLEMEKSTGDSFVQTVTLESDCNGNQEKIGPEQPQIRSEDKDGRLSVYYRDPNNMQDITAKIKLPKSQFVSLIVFDVSGRQVLSIDIPKGEKIETADIHLPTTGIYIIKAFTTEGEYTAKIVSH